VAEAEEGTEPICCGVTIVTVAGLWVTWVIGALRVTEVSSGGTSGVLPQQPMGRYNGWGWGSRLTRGLLKPVPDTGYGDSMLQP
jgi:hypothetical protein